MTEHKDRLADYIEVPDRIRDFKAHFPDGSLRRKEWHVKDVGGKTFIVYTALAYRTPDDKQPGEGTAWEPFPGTTPYTKNSELMNAETSAWGRALVALGFVGKKIASAEEVRNRSGEDKPSEPSQAAQKPQKSSGGPKPSPKQVGYFNRLVRETGVLVPQLEQMFADVGAEFDPSLVEGYASALSARQISPLIDRLKDGDLPPAPEPMPTGSDAGDDPSFTHPQASLEGTPMEEAA